MKTIINVLIMILITIIKIILIPVIFISELITYRFNFRYAVDGVRLSVFDKRNFNRMYYLIK